MNQEHEQSRAGNQSEEHTILQSIGLHLFPGILGGLVYFAISGYITGQGYPSLMALILALGFITTPLEFGILYHQSRKKNQKLFGEVIKYLDPLPWKDYLVWSIVIIIGLGAIMVLMGPITEALSRLFNWLPDHMILDMGLADYYDLNKIIITYTLVLLFVVLIGPATEELYFRGYLLPRIPSSMRGWGPIFHSCLFALYHIWTPWFFLARSIALLPLVYTVRYKKNLILGIISHCLLNSIDFFIGLVYISNHL